MGHAQDIVWDFNDNDGNVDSNGFSGDGVTLQPVATDDFGGSVTVDFGNQRAQRDLGTDAIQEDGSFAFTIEIGATPISLTQLDFDHGLDVDAGSVNTNYFDWTLDISTAGAGASQTNFAEFVSGGVGTDASFSESVTLSGLSNLSNTDVTFTFTGRYGTQSDYSSGQNTQRWTFLDDVTFSGSVVPEPSSSVLVALVGGLALLRRRCP